MMDAIVTVLFVSIVAGTLIALVLFGNYFRKRTAARANSRPPNSSPNVGNRSSKRRKRKNKLQAQSQVSPPPAAPSSGDPPPAAASSGDPPPAAASSGDPPPAAPSSGSPPPVALPPAATSEANVGSKSSRRRERRKRKSEQSHCQVSPPTGALPPAAPLPVTLPPAAPLSASPPRIAQPEAEVGNNSSKGRKSESQPQSHPQVVPPAVPEALHQNNESHLKSDKEANKQHHPLDLNTLKDHSDAVKGLCFSADGHSLATVCVDGVVKIFKVDDASSKSFEFQRIKVDGDPTAAAFSDDSSSLVVASKVPRRGSTLYMFEIERRHNAHGGTNQQRKHPLHKIKWEHPEAHEQREIITLFGTTATYGTADGSAIIVSCSKEDDIILWHGKSGKYLGTIDTHQLQNNTAVISPNGRFVAAAAITAGVKIWEVSYSKDGSAKDVFTAMHLKGHTGAVTRLCFTPNSEQIITASEDGRIRFWNINVPYHLDEDPKVQKVIPIPLQDASGATLHYKHLSISPDGRMLAATHGSILQWLSAETGHVLDTVRSAHDGDITSIAWAPRTLPTGGKQGMILATSSKDKTVKLWLAPPVAA